MHLLSGWCRPRNPFSLNQLLSPQKILLLLLESLGLFRKLVVI